MQCPECNTTLREELHLGIHVDPCPGCKGIWFDAGELESYRKRLTGESKLSSTRFVRDEDQPFLACPRCRQESLIIGDIGDRPIQKCANCDGVFVPSDTVESFRPRTAADVGGDIALEAAGQTGLEFLGDVLAWIIEGVFGGL